MSTALTHPAKLMVRLCALGAVVPLLAGCAGLGADTPGSVAQVRVIDASPDAPPLDVYQNKTGIAYSLGFGTVTSYVQLLPGNSAVSALSAGTRQTFVTSRQTLAAGRQYTAIFGNVAADIHELVLPDQTTPAPTGEVSLRLVHEATRAGAVDVYLVPKGGQLLGTAPFVTKLSLGRNAGYMNVPAGTYAIAVVPSGTVPMASTATLLSGPQVQYPTGSARTVVLIDQAMGVRKVQAIVADDFDPNAATS